MEKGDQKNCAKQSRSLDISQEQVPSKMESNMKENGF